MRRRALMQSFGSCAAAFALPASTLRAAEPAMLGRVSYQLSWIKNFQFAGEYVADQKGYFRQSGVEVALLSGGPTLPVDPVVASGKALIGQSVPDATANANLRGANLRVIGACYQKSPYCIISLSKTAIKLPQDMAGKKIGIQNSNLLIWRSFLKTNRIDARSITVVPVQFDFSPLVSGELDGFFGYINDDVVHLRAKGHEITYFLLADYGYKQFTATYTVNAESLSNKSTRAQLLAFMRGDIRGWQEVIDNPTLGAKLTVEDYGSGIGLDEKTEFQSCLMSNELMVTESTKTHGLFWMTDDSIHETISTLAAAGVKASPSMFTNEILAELYQGKALLQAPSSSAGP